MRENLYITFHNLPADKQNVIIDAAIVEFSQQGYAQASCNRIVRLAGISKGSLFQYFGSKEGLFSFICACFIRKVKDTVKGAGGGKQSFIDLIRTVLLSGIAFIDRYPDYFQIYLKIMFELDVPGRSEFLSKVQLFSVSYFGDALKDARDARTIRSDISEEMLLFTIDGCLDSFFMTYAGCGLGGMDLARLESDQLKGKIDELVAVLEDGLRGRACE